MAQIDMPLIVSICMKANEQAGQGGKGNAWLAHHGAHVQGQVSGWDGSDRYALNSEHLHEGK